MNLRTGRGVFASSSILKGTVVEVSPVLIFTKVEVEKHTSQTCLEHYTYYWPDPAGGPQTQAIALGLGSMFNHSIRRQNVIWARDIAAGTIVYTAHRDIEAGEELCISYGNARLWFEDADLKDEESELEDKDDFERSGLGKLMRVTTNEAEDVEADIFDDRKLVL